MEVGAIGYHDASKVKNLWVVKDKETVKRLDKTKEVLVSHYVFCFVVCTVHCTYLKSYILNTSCVLSGVNSVVLVV